MTGLPKKFAKMGFAKGWKAYRKAGSGKSKISSRKTKRKAKVSTKKRKSQKRRKRSATAKPINLFKRLKRRSRKVGISMAKGQKANIAGELQNIGMGAAGAIGGTMISNMIPLPDPRMKAGIPLIGGMILALMMGKKMPIMKKIGLGMSIGGALAIVKAIAPNMPLLAGEEAPQIAYTADDVQQALLTGQITPDEAQALISPELMGESEEFAGEDEEIEAAETSDWQTNADAF